MENLSLKQLEDPKIIKQIEQEVGELDNFGRAAEDIPGKIATMFSLDKIIKENPNLKKSAPDLFSQINKNLIKLKGYLLDFMDDEELLKFMEEHILDLVKYNVAFEERIKNFLLQKSYKVRDDFLEKVRVALENNREELGDNILLGEKKANVKGYIKNWIQDFNNFLGVGRHIKIDIAKYLFQSPNVKFLDAESKNYLKKILEFYEKTKLKVNEPFGLGAYPPEMFGVEVIGEAGSLRAKFQTTEGKELPDIEFEKTTEEPSEELIPQEQEVVSAEAWAKLEEQRKAAAANIGKEKDGKDPEPQKQEAVKETEARQSGPLTKSVPEPKKEISFSMEGVESIKKLNADVFRKISADPAQAAEKIKSEAAKLIQANPENIIIAKEMWQQSDLYKLYLEIAQEGMETGLPVDKVIGARAKMGKPSLSKKEFEVVVDLSKVF